MKRLIVILAVLVVAGISGGVALQHAGELFAQDNNGPKERITLSPASEELSMEAGTEKSGKITVINNGETDYRFNVYAAPFSVKGEDYNPDFTTVNERTRAYEWIEFTQTSLQLDAGERTTVDYTLDVPENAAPGGHYAVLFAETQPPEGEASVARKKRIGTLLYLSVDGDIQTSGSLGSLTTKFWQTGAPITSDVRVKNDGNVHFTANLDAHYKNLFGRQQFQLKKETRIMPGTTRRIPVAWENAPYFGIFKTGGTVTFLDTTEDLPEQYVILLPYPLLAGLVGAIVLLVSYIVLKRRRLNGGRVNFASKAKKR